MNPIRAGCIVVTVSFLLAGCGAATRQYLPAPELSRESGNVIVYVFRPDSPASVLPVQISDGDQAVGRLGRGSYLCWEREPGDVALSVSFKTINVRGYRFTDTLRFNAEKGATCYIMLEPRMGFLVGPPHMYPKLVTAEKGEALLRRCAPAELLYTK